jgi:hypothetical protein
MTNRWLLLNYDTLGAVAVLITTVFSISTLRDEAGLAGLCITSAMAFTNAGNHIFFSYLHEIKLFSLQFIGLAELGPVSARIP